MTRRIGGGRFRLTDAGLAARATRYLAAAVIGAALFAPGATSQTAPRPGQRVALVTGSTSGLGREVAIRLGALGMHVIVHGRDAERGAEVVADVERAGGTARFYQADFGSFAEVRALGEAIQRDYDRLHVLVNNAGFGRAPNERMVTQDGHELRLQVNHLAHFLLTRMLEQFLDMFNAFETGFRLNRPPDEIGRLPP